MCGRKYYESFPGENTDAFSGQILQLLRDNKNPPEDAEPRDSFVLKRNSSLGEMVSEHLNHLSETDPAKCERHYQAIMGFVSQLDSSSEATNMLSSSRDVLYLLVYGILKYQENNFNFFTNSEFYLSFTETSGFSVMNSGCS